MRSLVAIWLEVREQVYLGTYEKSVPCLNCLILAVWQILTCSQMEKAQEWYELTTTELFFNDV